MSGRLDTTEQRRLVCDACGFETVDSETLECALCVSEAERVALVNVAQAAKRMEALLIPVTTYIEHFVSVEDALVDGFDAEEWCVQARAALAALAPAEPEEA